uniref:DELTA-actitoxin-Afr1a-like n=1 Tax=Scleropages formosus TaxID=113540 RepID=A0A8C9R8D7_SCLFO
MSGFGSGATLVNAILQQYHNTTDRCVSISLSNCSETHSLVNPQVYTYSGYCYNPPQPTVRPGVTEMCFFGKATAGATGAVGVLTYDIVEEEKHVLGRLAIMFSVPYNYNHYQNFFALGIFEKDKECDESLYKHMYYDAKGRFCRSKSVGSEISYIEKLERFKVRGTMSPMGKSVMKVELWDHCCN